MIVGAVYRSPGICLTAEENPRKRQLRKPSDEVAVHRSPGICLKTEETPGKPQLGVCLMTSYCLKWGPSPPNEVGRIAQLVRKGEGWKKDALESSRVF